MCGKSSRMIRLFLHRWFTRWVWARLTHQRCPQLHYDKIILFNNFLFLFSIITRCYSNYDWWVNKGIYKKVVYRQIPHERSEWYFYRQIIPVSYSDTKIDRTHSSGESSMQRYSFYPGWFSTQKDTQTRIIYIMD